MLYYNGIYLNLLKVHEYRREAIYNATDYVRTRHTLVVRAVINPATSGAYLNKNAINVPGFPPPGLIKIDNNKDLAGWNKIFNDALIAQNPNGGVGPSRVVGQVQGLTAGNAVPLAQIIPGSLSVAAILHDLMQPRRKLLYEVGGVVVLVSPILKFYTDSANGPTPLFCNIVEFQGPRSVVVDFGIQTEINECPYRTTDGWIVRSHVFTTQHEIDQDFFTKRIVTGRVVFDAAPLNSSLLARDDFRWLIIHPVPVNCKRQQVEVKALEDGITYEYKIVDVELPFNINIGAYGNIITRIEGQHLVHISSPEPERVIAERLYKAFEAAERGGSNLFTAKFFATAAATTTIKLAPTAKHSMMVRVWGNRNATRNLLQRAAEDLILARRQASVQPISGQFVNGWLGVGLSRTVIHDINGKFVEVHDSFETGPIATATQLGLLASGNVTFFPKTDDSGNILKSDPSILNPQPPDDPYGTRGTMIERAISKDLVYQEPCEVTAYAGAFSNRAGEGAPIDYAGTPLPPVDPNNNGGGGVINGGLGFVPKIVVRPDWDFVSGI